MEDCARAVDTRQATYMGPRGLRIKDRAALLTIAVLVLAGACCAAASYKLPYTCGKSYVVTQGNSSLPTHTGKARYAFDFGMPVGSQVVGNVLVLSRLTFCN